MANNWVLIGGFNNDYEGGERGTYLPDWEMHGM